MIPVILSGGSGTRLWPVSRSRFPKQFSYLLEESLQGLTMRRLAKLGTPWIITGQNLRDLTEKKKREMGLNQCRCVYEPFGKNTAPAIALLAHLMSLEGLANEVAGIFPADQLIENEEVFYASVEAAIKVAEQGQVVTLGIKPTHPSTGFGYIQTASKSPEGNEPILTDNQVKSFSVIKFHEKPSVELATAFFKSGNYFWNAGIFIFKVSRMIDHLKDYEPALWSEITKVKADLSNIADVYKGVQNISIDYAIMEKLSSKELSCIPGDMGWNDVGSWDAIADLDASSGGGLYKECIVSHNSKNNFIYPQTGKVYALAGVDDLIVVDTKDALMITKRGQSQDVKMLVDQLKGIRKQVVDDHMFEERPWGKYEVLKDTDFFKSKVIQIDPGAQISYQLHNQREENWIIVRGQGEFTLNDQARKVKAGDNLHIPKQAKHMIKNTGSEILEFVEVQLGNYFGEDDIIRISDVYQRL